MTLYHIYVVYEDGSTYQSTISSQNDVDKIPKNKGYEAIKIVYFDNTDYSHVIYGIDFVYLEYNDDGRFLVIGQWDEPTHDNNPDNKEGLKLSKEIVELRGVDKETIINNKDITNKRLKKTFEGKRIDDLTYEKYRLRCENWQPIL